MEQNVLMYTFYLSSIIGFLSLLFIKKIDARTVFFMGTVVYGLPLYWGYTQYKVSNLYGGMQYMNYIEPEIYVTFIFSQLVYLASLISIKKKNNSINKMNFKSKKIVDYNVLLIALTISLLISISAFIITTGIETFTLSVRSEKIARYTIWYFISGTISTSVIILSIMLRMNWKWFIIPILYLFFDLVMGDRTFLFLGFISFTITFFYSREIKLAIKKRLIIGFSLLSVLLIAFLYKPFYFAISLGYFKFEDIGEYIYRSIIGSEPFVIIGNFNEIVRYGGISLEKTYLFETIVGYLPFYETLTNNSRVSFNSLFQNILFPYTEWGLGSTAYGELYSIGGMAGIIFYLVFIFSLLKIEPPNSQIIKLLYFYLVPYILFYFHRTDWHSFIGTTRLFIYSFILIFPIYIFIYIIRHERKSIT